MADRKVKKYYFTYGTDENYPFRGGWTEVVAPSLLAAKHLFRAFHPDKTEGILNCADVYPQALFETWGFLDEGNLGAFCHEVIAISRCVLTPTSSEGEA